jgi:pimeloyl-ACP methyl ester carboxylesterase
MSRIARSTLLLVVALALLATLPLQALAAPDGQPGPEAAVPALIQGPFSVCSEDQPHENSDAVYRICTPPWWWPSNGDLVIWAHGYVDETRPVEIPEDQLCLGDGLCIPDLVNYLGYDFATTSYAVNGLAVVPGIQDVVELVDLYTAQHGAPGRVYLVGASEGGLITTLAVEQYPEVFDGGLATCGPIGDFAGQINYFGDFRAVLDYFYPGLVPGDPTDIPPELIETWDTYYPETVYPEVFGPANRNALKQLVRVTRIPFDRGNLGPTLETSVEDVLWYNVFATNNASDVLGGQPFDNADRIYRGSSDDDALNAGIARFAADQAALDEIEANYQTSGELAVPLVTLHTTLDQQVPYWHEKLYLRKTMRSGAWPELHAEYPPTEAYGHCQFVVDDVLGAFDLLVLMVTGGGLDQDLVEGLLSTLGPDAGPLQLHDYR